jgi:hypothetical protein
VIGPRAVLPQHEPPLLRRFSAGLAACTKRRQQDGEKRRTGKDRAGAPTFLHEVPALLDELRAGKETVALHRVSDLHSQNETGSDMGKCTDTRTSSTLM